MRSRPFAALDSLTLVLIVLGALLVAASIVGFVALAQPTRATPELSATASTLATSETLPAPDPDPDSVATALRVDATAGVGGAARVGDHVDVLGYFSRQVTGDENVTRLLVSDVPVLAVAPDASGATLTLAMPQSTALLLHEAQALGARPFVVLRAANGSLAYPPSLNDSQLADRLAQGLTGAR